MVGYIFGGNTGQTAESLAQQRAYAQALMAAGQQPAQNIPQGIAQLANTLMGGLVNSKISGEAADATAGYNKALAAALGVPDTSPKAEPTFGQKLGNMLSGKGWNANAGEPVAPPAATPQAMVGGNAPGDVLQNYIASAKGSESGGNVAAKNPNSSATGLFQFTDGTWNGVAKAHPELGLTSDGRLDPAQQELAMRAFTMDNANSLKNWGIPVNGGSLYAMHFLGGGAAPRVLTAPPNTPMTSLVPSEVIKANPFLANMRASDFAQWAAQKGGAGSAQAQAADLRANDQSGAGVRIAGVEGMFPDFGPQAITGGQTIPGDNWNLPGGANPSYQPPQALAMAPQAQQQQIQQAMPTAPAQRPISTAGLNYDPATGAIGPAANLGPGATLAPAAREAFLGRGGGQAMMPQQSPQMPIQAGGGQQTPSMPQAGASPQQRPPQAASGIPGMNPQIAGLMQALQNPYLDPQTRAAGTQMLQTLIAQNQPQREFITTPDGQVLVADKRTGQVSQAYNGGMKPIAVGEGQTLVDPATGKQIFAGQPQKTSEQKDYERAVAGGFNGSFFDYQTAVKRAGTPTTEGKFDQEVGTQQAKMFSDLLTDGQQAQQDLATIGQLRDVISKTPGGMAGGLQAWANSFGIKLGPNVSDVEAANSLISKLVPQQRQGMPGAASDRDVQMFRDALPKLSNTPEGNTLILNTAQALAENKLRQGQIATAVMTGQMSRQDALVALQQMPDPFAAFRQAAGTMPQPDQQRGTLGLGNPPQQQGGSVIPTDIPGVTIRRLD